MKGSILFRATARNHFLGHFLGRTTGKCAPRPSRLSLPVRGPVLWPITRVALDAVTGPSTTYVRLLGDSESVDALTPTLDHIVINRGEQVKADAGAIMLLSKRVPVVAFVNNHFAGFAPETLRQLAAQIA